MRTQHEQDAADGGHPMKLKVPCPHCGLLCKRGAAFREHALTHAVAPHPNTGNPHGPKSIGVPQVSRRMHLTLEQKSALAEKHKLLL